MIRKILLLVFSFAPYLLFSQYYVLGDDPSGIHWKQINTSNFQIIYPSKFESEAMRMAAILNKSMPFAAMSLQHKPSKISVILHTSTVRSNGFVAWAPARVELFTTPHQEIYAQDWLEQLAIHEYRHVVQIDKIDSELPGLLKILLGEQAAALVTGIYLPFWYLEGDAVVTETALSHTGRGRVPSFEMELKAQTLEKGVYSYDKAYLGSFKDYIPDYYQLGYQIVAGVRSRYGSNSWAKVLDHVAHNPLSMNAFSAGLKGLTGMNYNKLYETIFSELKNKWESSDLALEKTNFELLTKEQPGYISYRYPFPINDSTVFAVRYSMDELTRFVEIGTNGRQKVLFTPGNLFEESITYGHNKIFWIESLSDVRWAHREFSLLRMLNLTNGELIEKKYQEKIYAPCLSVDGEHLAAVKIDIENKCSIVLISPKTGVIEKEIKLANDFFVLSPSWAENNQELYAVVLGNKGKTLAKINAFTGKVTLLIPWSYNEPRKPVQRGDFVYYTGTIGGTDDLYAYNLIQKVNYRITKSRFGVRDVQPSLNGNNLLYSNYTANGYKVVKMALQPLKFAKLDTIATYPYKLADMLTAQEGAIIDFSVPDSTTYHSNSYSKVEHIFNFHSWAPVHIDLAANEIRPGFSLFSQNKLGTAITQLGYDYSTINRTGKGVAEFDYTGLFPVLKLRGEYGLERSRYYQINTYTNKLSNIIRKDTQQVNFNYNILNINGISNIPFNLSHGKWNRLIQPEFQIEYRQTFQNVSTPISSGNNTWLTYRLYAHNLIQEGFRDLQPAIGQILDINYHYSPFKSASKGTIWTVEGTFYLPGLVRHHGIRIYTGIQNKQSYNGILSDYIYYPRGYTNLLNTNLVCIKSDYVLPLFYPDWSVGRLSYFKRVSLRAFYDQAWAMIPIYHQNSEYSAAFSSVGGELTADCNFLRLYVPAKIGIRTSYLINERSYIFEFLLSINFKAL